MKTTNGPLQPHVAATLEYESPALVVIGDASEVVLGVGSGGFDGRFQMTEFEFEFEADRPED